MFRCLSRPLAGRKINWSALSLAFLFLLIEFFDELHDGAGRAVLPVLRSDLALTYAQVGLLLGLPRLVNTLIEPFLMLLGDTHLRKRLVLGGGFVLAAVLALVAGATSFPPLLVAFIILYPASGAFVSLSQATLMDLNPGREAQMMARWTVAGSLANLAGPLLVAGGFALALGWRWAYVLLAALALALTLLLVPRSFPHNALVAEQENHSARRVLGDLLRSAWVALRNRRLLRWLGLLELADLLMDVFSSYVALYFADVVGLTSAQTGIMLSLLMLTGLVSDLLLIPLLERVPGRRLVRISAGASVLIYAAWLLAPWVWAKLVLAVLIRFSTLGWYQVLQGEAYAALRGRSGTVMALNSLAGLLGGALIWLVGWTAEQAGLPLAMWLLLLGPLSLLLCVPRPSHTQQ